MTVRSCRDEMDRGLSPHCIAPQRNFSSVAGGPGVTIR
ncbi:hypothetical protein A33M_2043 [Rhodovulum sp. PH10]|nr:hypothetical protein A33M_2043 [Rhodovulum sp. PH10]